MLSQRLACSSGTVLIALSIAACGASNSGPTSPGQGGSSGLAGKEAKAILNDAASALKEVDSYHIEGDGEDKDGHVAFSTDIAGNGSMRIKTDSGGEVVEVVVVGQQTFLKGNEAFWTKEDAGPNAKRLADVWVDAPAGSEADLKKAFAALRPGQVAYCLTQHVGTLSKGGTESVDGRQTVVLVDKGDTSAAEPGKLYVATDGPPLPLRVTQTGPRTPGGKLDPRCDAADTTTTAMDVKLSKFGEQFDIRAPANPATIDDLLT
jgi:hypothetical protein